MSDSMRTAMCYRADGSLKWATWLPGDATIPTTTLEDGDTLWPYVMYGREDDGRTFFVPVKEPIKGPAVTGATTGKLRC